MDLVTEESLSEELALAVAHTPAESRARFASFLAFDQRLARIIAQTTEPMLAQIRIAWWRDTLALPVEERPTGDVVLDAIGEHWRGDEALLIELANGWEEMLSEAPLSEQAIEHFLAARAEPFAKISSHGCQPKTYSTVNHAARIWALADMAINASDPEERAGLIAKGQTLVQSRARMPAEWRGLAVLRALSRRSLGSDAQPLMEGRGAALAALWAALTGR